MAAQPHLTRSYEVDVRPRTGVRIETYEDDAIPRAEAAISSWVVLVPIILMWLALYGLVRFVEAALGISTWL